MAPDPSRPTTSAPAFSGTPTSASATPAATPPGLTNVDMGAVELNRDMSQYIRTYAKDVARATNQPAPAPVAKPATVTEAALAPKLPPTLEPKKNPVLQAVLKEKNLAGVVLPETDSSPVNRPNGIAKEFVTETVDLKKEDSAGIFAQKNQPAPAAASTSPYVPPAPVRVAAHQVAPTPVQPPAPKPIQPTPVPKPFTPPVPPVAPAVPSPAAPPITTPPLPPKPAPAPIAPPKPVPTPLPPKPVPPPLPSPTPRPAPIPQAAITHTPTPASTTNLDEDREAVLARLRKKLADSRAGSMPPAPMAPASVPPMPPPRPAAPPTPAPMPQQVRPVPPPLPPPPVPTPAPTTPPIPPPVPLTRPAPVVESAWQPPAPPRPIPQPIAVPMPAPAAPQQRGPDPLHTYSSDFAGRIDQQQASAFSVLAAQQDAGQGKPVPEPPARRSLLPIILAVLLIVLGAVGLFAAYRFINPPNSGQQTLGVPSLIFADEKMELKGPDYRQSLANATNEPLVEGNILVTYVTTASSTALGLNEPQPGGVLIRLLNLGAPDILLRNVDLLSTVGIIRAGSETRPFFILRVNSYERTFAGMLGWEQRMLASLDPLYPLYADPAPFMPADMGTSTPVGAATTTNTQTSFAPPVVNAPAPAFVDIVVANYDARALKDASGRTLIIYGYSNSQTLIIARDEAAFTALIARLAASSSL